MDAIKEVQHLIDFFYLSHVHLERFIDDGKSRIVLNVLPSAIPVDNNAGKKPVVVSERVKCYCFKSM